MSLPRASYLESWEYDPFRQRQRPSVAATDRDEESVDNGNADVPESVIPSSFSSSYSQPQRLTFNPYSGPGWTQGSAYDGEDDEEEAVSPTRMTSDQQQQQQQQQQPRLLPKDQDWDCPVTMGAFEVPAKTRIAQVCIAVVYCFLAAGVVFGFAALKPILIQEQVYRHLCTKDELDKDVSVCYGQELRYYPFCPRSWAEAD